MPAAAKAFFNEASTLRSVISMDERKAEVIRRIRSYGILKDPQWLERPDELVPLWVMLDAILELIERFDPPNRPFD